MYINAFVRRLYNTTCRFPPTALVTHDMSFVQPSYETCSLRVMCSIVTRPIPNISLLSQRKIKFEQCKASFNNVSSLNYNLNERLVMILDRKLRI